MSEKVTLNGIYCDDIRNEVGGKVSLIGVYQTDMVFPQFPAIAPKFCASITLRFPFQSRPTKSLLVQIFTDENEIGRIEIDESQIQNIGLPPLDPDIPPEERFLSMQTSIVFSPLVIEGPCKLRLRANIDGREVKGNALKIRLASQEERIANGWPAVQNEETQGKPE